MLYLLYRLLILVCLLHYPQSCLCLLPSLLGPVLVPGHPLAHHRLKFPKLQVEIKKCSFQPVIECISLNAVGSVCFLSALLKSYRIHTRPHTLVCIKILCTYHTFVLKLAYHANCSMQKEKRKLV